jgi:membrane-bound lytic murein transglycosylase B
MREKTRIGCRRAMLCALAVLLASVPAHAAPRGYAQRSEVLAFVERMHREHGFSRSELRRLFAQVRHQPRVIAAMERPIAAPPTYDDFAPRFLSTARIEAGAEFWRAHAEALERARRTFGVPPEIIVAIIGVETYYGRNAGGYRVLDALTTLAFDYPRRSDFFRGELEQFLLLAREQGISPLTPKGSYAGAIGLPQFMPGSIRSYAVDFDADGRIDLADDADDAIGSVAQYLARHGWQPGQPVMTAARIDTADPDPVLKRFDGGVAERRSLAAWTQDGVTGFMIPADLAPDPVGLVMLETNGSPTYWLTFENWYALTRYNRSRLYASVVWQLGERLREAAEAEIPLRRD